MIVYTTDISYFPKHRDLNTWQRQQRALVLSSFQVHGYFILSLSRTLCTWKHVEQDNTQSMANCDIGEMMGLHKFCAGPQAMGWCYSHLGCNLYPQLIHTGNTSTNMSKDGFFQFPSGFWIQSTWEQSSTITQPYLDTLNGISIA